MTAIATENYSHSRSENDYHLEVGVVPPRGYCKYWNIATHTTKVEMDYYKINPTERERERENNYNYVYY